MAIPKLSPAYSSIGEFHKSAKKVPSSPTTLTPDRKSLSYGQLYSDQLIICNNPFLRDVVGEIQVCGAEILGGDNIMKNSAATNWDDDFIDIINSINNQNPLYPVNRELRFNSGKSAWIR